MTPWLRASIDLARQRVLERAMPGSSENVPASAVPTRPGGPQLLRRWSCSDHGCLPDQDHYCVECGRELEG